MLSKLNISAKLTKSSTTKSAQIASPLVLIGVGIVAILFGIFAVFYTSLVGNHYGALLAFPALIILGVLFLFARETLFLFIILFRSALDQVFDTTRVGSFGLGAAVNALVIMLAIIAIYERPSPVNKVLKQTWMGFLLISIVSLAMAPEFIIGLKTYLALVSYAAMFGLAIALIKSEEDYGKWMRAIFLSSIIPVLYGFVDAATGGFRSTNGFRINSTFNHPNVFAFYLVLLISLAFYFYKSKVSYLHVFIRKCIPIYIILMIALLLLTKTRSAWVACFAFFLIYGLIYERKYLLFIVLSLVGAAFIPEIRDRFLDLLQGNEVINYSQLNSYAWRKKIWTEGLSWMAPSHYLFGYGLDAFKHYSVDFFTMAGGEERGAHSVYVQLFFDTGAIGLAAFVWLHVKTGKLLLPFYKMNKLMIFSAIMFLLEFGLDAYSDNMLAYLSFNWYLWFVLGAAYAVNYARQKDLVKNIATDSTNVIEK